MANQEITLVGNIGQNISFTEQGERNLAEINVVCEEYKQTDNGVEVREGSQNWYQVTVWGNENSLAPLRVLQKGMRIQVTGVLKPTLFQKKDRTTGLGLAVNCQASDVLLKLNRIEQIVMRKSERNQESPAMQNQATGFNQNDMNQNANYQQGMMQGHNNQNQMPSEDPFPG
ncbi:single-stranded DNA-binding protein [Thiomicrorhabdus indica]|uniref:single-stranded DNA-binding protein n=1 Tax=Thiomicrorhabdus indica TaxID=2267253 RepID=UPI00102DC578|nr:single-stranded DNA-binding protein [Thiomicrorhabdus indica]